MKERVGERRQEERKGRQKEGEKGGGKESINTPPSISAYAPGKTVINQ